MIDNNVKLIISKLDDKQAEDIRVININEISTIADYFVIANAKVDDVLDELAKEGIHEISIEGNYTSGWVLIDFGDIILHVFDRENRLFYNLEKMWKDGKEMDINEFVGGKNESQN